MSKLPPVPAAYELSDRPSAISLSGTARLVLGCLSTSGHSWEAGRISHPLTMKNLNHAFKKKSLLKTSVKLQKLSPLRGGELGLGVKIEKCLLVKFLFLDVRN